MQKATHAFGLAQISDEDLMHRYQMGDITAFEVLYSKCWFAI